MEKVFKSKGCTALEMWGLLACFLLFVFFAVVNDWSALIGGLIPFIFLADAYTKRYIVKENGDMWVRSIFGQGAKAVGVRRILYDPHAKGWQWRNRQMIISYKRDLKQGFFPIIPADPEGLIAALKEKNPDMDVKCFEMPVK